MVYKVKDEALFKKLEFEPHKHQKNVLKMIDKEREILCRAGRRGGKSKLSAFAAIKTLLKGNTDVWVVSVSYDLASIVFDTIVIELSKILTAGEDFTVQKKSPQKLHIPSFNSVLYARSADNPTSLLGRSTDMVIMDEAAEIHQNIWERYIYPTTSDRGGKIVYISTPKGRNWFYEKDLELQKKGCSFHWWSKENPHFPKDEWRKAQKKLSKREFAAQYMAEYTNLADPVFGDVRRIVGQCLEEPKKGHHYVIGIDFGRRVDATAIIIIDRTNHKVVNYTSLKDKEWSAQKGIIKNLALKYNNAKLIAESTGVGDALVGELFRDGLFVEEFRTAAHNKTNLIEKLVVYIEQEMITIPNSEELIEQLEGYEKTITEWGNAKYNAPGRRHDDSVIALALAVQDLQEPISPKIQKEDDNDPIGLFKETKKRRKTLNQYE